MPKFVIERTVPGLAQLGPAELQSVARKACEALDSMGPEIHWIETFVTADKLYCVFYAPDEATLRLHSQHMGCSVDRISEVRTTVDPGTAGREPESHSGSPVDSNP